MQVLIERPGGKPMRKTIWGLSKVRWWRHAVRVCVWFIAGCSSLLFKSGP